MYFLINFSVLRTFVGDESYGESLYNLWGNFSSILGRIKHEKASHSLIELKCKECKYVALGKKKLNNHIQIHKENEKILQS